MLCSSYAKAYDPDNWFTIDEETAEIKLNKVPDRESPFLVNGTYIAKILAITNGKVTPLSTIKLPSCLLEPLSLTSKPYYQPMSSL